MCSCFDYAAFHPNEIDGVVYFCCGAVGQVIYCYIQQNRGITRTITIQIEMEMWYEIEFVFLHVACQKISHYDVRVERDGEEKKSPNVIQFLMDLLSPTTKKAKNAE